MSVNRERKTGTSLVRVEWIQHTHGCCDSFEREIPVIVGTGEEAVYGLLVIVEQSVTRYHLVVRPGCRAAYMVAEKSARWP